MFARFWYEMVGAVEGAAAAAVIVGGLAGIAGVLLFSVLRLRQKHAAAAVALSTLVGCALMVPVVSAFNRLVELRVGGALADEGRAEVRAQRAELARLKAEDAARALEREKLENEITIARQSIEIEALNDNIALLESAGVSLQSFEKILEVALLQTNLKQTLVRKESLSPLEKGWGLRANFFNDEALVVITHDILAKFGVDLAGVKVSRFDGGTIIVSGITPKFIGTSRNVSNTVLKEFRRVNYKLGVVASVDTKYDSASMARVDRAASGYEAEFQRKLSEGRELEFMNDAVVQLAENFLTVMLAPVYRNIRFSAETRPDALPLVEYLQKELAENRERKAELLEQNETLRAANAQPEAASAGE